MAVPTGSPAPGWYPDPGGTGGQRYWDGQQWTAYAPRQQGVSAGWSRRTQISVVAGVAAAGLIVALFASFSSASGPSESYEWGQKAGNSAVSLVQAGMDLGVACDSSLSMGAMWADDPILNPTPPPKNYDRADAKKGCLDQLHKQLGY